MNKAALYLRSSKDRSDVSIEAQRGQLMDLAKQKGFDVVREYVDVVESAKTVNRPAFQEMILGIKDKERGYENILFLDTSRLSRRRYHAQAFKHECRKRGVEIHYAKLPDVDPITKVLLESMFEAMDEVHSLMSREKGLAGMAENVRQGFRAGGRAPYGYELKKIGMGTIREGSEVTKTKLKPSKDAPKVRNFLKARAQGVNRARAAKDAGIKKAQSTLIGMEWNALTYAGNTVWNVQNSKVKGEGYKGMPKRKPRTDWMINESTHKALITRDEAEQILNQLEQAASKRQPRHNHFYLLSGLLESFEGEHYHGDGGKYYAIKKGTTKIRINKNDIESAVLDHFSKHIQSARFVEGIYARAKKQAEQSKADVTPLLRKRLDKISNKIAKLLDMGLELENNAPVLRQIEPLERDRKEIESEIIEAEKAQRQDNVLIQLTRADVTDMLASVSEILKEADQASVRALLESLVERVQADKATNRVKLHYAIGVKVASPRGSKSNPIIRLIREALF